MKLQGVIFDADGTLLDSMYIWETIGSDFLRSLGIEPRENLTETFRAMSLGQAARYYQTHYSVKLTADEIICGINDMIAGFYRNTVTLKPGASVLLDALASGGVHMCIATATDRVLIEAVLQREGVAQYIDSIFTCGEVKAGKDDPLIYETAHASLGTNKAHTLVFEDALHALTTAHCAGFPTAAVYDPSEPRQEALRAIADYYFKDLNQAKEKLL